ncbi:DeoR/GlpR family DNA-binding transcription regulator [Desulfovibrio cuneatus]|uniref:DeoR/GlpR family DNA-binding transcription regulator n=1 Tax=Desulfovibrio cuneatus TaxID=159728 RepID=UPI0006877CB3|nr:DeoR/GlpR family DNA-binding transcription regulator [Desulfovibrio cuneatus]
MEHSSTPAHAISHPVRGEQASAPKGEGEPFHALVPTCQDPLLPEQRRQRMAQLIQQRGAVHTRELAKALGTSMMTIRRDLKVLEQQNFLQTTWGGAVPRNFQPHDIPYSHKATHMLAAKQAIARAAAQLVQEDTCLVLDAGTTTLELARLLAGRRLTVVTNDLQIALVLAPHPQTTVHVTGGTIDPVSLSCIDASSLTMLGSVHASLAFIGTNVWDAQRGVTTSSREKMSLKQRMMHSAEASILLVDSTKYANYSPWHVADLTGFTEVITDSGLPAATRKGLLTTGVQLRIA